MLEQNGFNLLRLSTIIANITAAQKLVFPDLELDPSTPDGQLNGLFSEAIALSYELGLDIYNGLDPNTAEGIMLDRVSGITATVRKQPAKTKVVIEFTGEPATTIPAGTMVSASSIANTNFTVLQGVQIGLDGIAMTVCESDEFGALLVTVGAIDTIDSSITGVDSVTNNIAGASGNLLETDYELRVRRRRELALGSEGLINSVNSAVSRVEGVLTTRVFENKQTSTSPQGVPAHSIWVVVAGGESLAIANAIMSTKSLGAGLHGDESEIWIDNNNFTHNVRFSRPTQVDVFIKVTARAHNAWSGTFTQEIKDALLQYIADVRTGSSTCAQIEGFNISDDVYASSLYPPIITSDKYAIEGILVGLVAPANEQTALIALHEVSNFSEANITVVGV